MIKYSKLNNELKQKVYDCYNNNVGDFYKKISYEDFCSNLYNHIEFDENGVFVAVEDELVVGFIACHVRGIEKEDCDKPCCISTFIVYKKYRHQGIGKELLDKFTTTFDYEQNTITFTANKERFININIFTKQKI